MGTNYTNIVITKLMTCVKPGFKYKMHFFFFSTKSINAKELKTNFDFLFLTVLMFLKYFLSFC